MRASLYFPSMSPPLSQKWSVNLGSTVSYPIVVGSRIFVVTGGTTSTLYALDAQTGSVLWTQPSPAGYGGWAGATYDNGMLFVVSYQTPGFVSGAMFAFSAIDGHQIWNTTLPSQYLFTSAPTAFNGIVYTGGAGYGGTVYAVQEAAGAVLWTAPVANGDSSAPAVSSDGVYVSYVCPQTYKFNPTSGQLIWHYNGGCEGGGGASAALYQGMVYVRDIIDYPTDGITLSATNGSYVGGFNSTYSPAFWQNLAFYTEPSYLTAFDLTTSRFLWLELPQNGDSYSCAPIVVNGVVYAGTAEGNLYGYSADTGSELFSANLGQAISCSEAGSLPLAGLSAGAGLLVVPSGSQLVAFQFDNFGAWQFVPTPRAVWSTHARPTIPFKAVLRRTSTFRNLVVATFPRRRPRTR